MTTHSYGHGQYCYYCGRDGDTEDDVPCDFSLRKPPTELQMQHYYCTEACGEVRFALEEAERTCGLHGYHDASKELYDLRLQLTEVERRLESLSPRRSAKRRSWPGARRQRSTRA